MPPALLEDFFMQKNFPEAGDASGPQIDTGYKVMASGSTVYPTLGGTSVEAAFDFPKVIPFINSVLETIDQGVDSDNPVIPAGYLSLRVCGRTAALLGMEQFKRNGMFEVTFIGNPDGFQVVKSVEQITLDQQGALHWGQSNGRLGPDYAGARFPGLNTWQNIQRTLGGDTFINLFMRRCGLAAG